jgi:hypothetical protein
VTVDKAIPQQTGGAGRPRAEGARADATRRPVVRVRRLVRVVSGTVAFAAFAVLLLIGLPTAHSRPGSIALVILAALSAGLAVRAAGASVAIGGDGVVVRDVFHTHRLGWADVVRLASSSDDFLHGTAAIETTDGRRIRLFALNGPGWWDSRSDAYVQICSRVAQLIDEGKADFERVAAKSS